jgi:uncharacterized protein (TIGR03435 family)
LVDIAVSFIMKLSLPFRLVPTVLLGTSLLLSAQGAFDVASVKPNVSGDEPSVPRISPGRFSWTNVSLRQLIQVAYDMRPYQLIALPNWADTARFDVAVTTSITASRQEMNTMLQSLLADRFDLSVHRERREVPVYALVLARRDGKLGPNIHPATLDCQSIAEKPLNSGTAQTDSATCSPQLGLTRLKVAGFRMSGLASGLMRILDRTVIDKTDLSEPFDMELSWTPDPTMLPNGVPAPQNLPSAGPSIFTALEEQLGLRLVSDRAPVEALVIDRIKALKPD